MARRTERSSPAHSRTQSDKLRPLRGKVAVVTGANRGIGLATARLLAAAGCNLAITARDRKALASATDDLERRNVRVLSSVCDVREPRLVAQFFADVRRRFDRVDILFNNAGVTHPPAPVRELALEQWRNVIDTNLTGLFLCTRAALPLIPAGGTIVNNLSVAAKGNYPGASAYDASKHGALGFTNTLRMEMRERGIRVIALLPGPTDTAMWNVIWPGAPRKKMMSAESVASVLVSALTLPENAAVEELVIAPTGGAL